MMNKRHHCISRVTVFQLTAPESENDSYQNLTRSLNHDETSDTAFSIHLVCQTPARFEAFHLNFVSHLDHTIVTLEFDNSTSLVSSVSHRVSNVFLIP